MKSKIQQIYKAFFYDEIIIYKVPKKIFFIGIVLLFFAGFRVYYNIYDYMDVVFGDEVLYMKTGINMMHNFDRNWGPLYCLWYKFLSLFISNTMNLYYFNFAFIAVVCSVLIYLAFVSLGIHNVVAFYLSLCFVSSKFMVPMWPRVSFFVVSLLMISIIIMTKIKPVLVRLCVFLITLLLVSYARPELYLSFIITLIIILFFILFNISKAKKYYKILIATLMVVVVLHCIFRFPSNQYFGYDRSVAAFFQHYILNQFFRGNANSLDWIYWQDTHQKYFGNCNSMLCILKNYPIEISSNFLYNVYNCTKEILIKNIFLLFPFCNGMNKLLLFGTFFILVASVSMLFIKRVRLKLYIELKNHFFYLAIIFIWGIPAMISSLLIFPRDHYIMVNYFLFFIPLAFLFSIILKRMNIHSLKAMLLLAVIFIPFLSDSKYHYFFLDDHEKNNMCSRKAVELIQKKKWNPNKTYTIFSDIHCFNGFLPNNFKEINTMFQKPKDVLFSTILNNNNIDIILVNDCINETPSMKDDKTWQQFLKNPIPYGYHYQFEKGCNLYFLIKNDVEYQ